MNGRKLSRIGVLSACAVAAYVFESFIPVPVPWARVGLSNIVVLIALFGFGFKEALLVTLVRLVAGNLLLGVIMSPAFAMSLAGGMAALAVMAAARAVAVPPLSITGASVTGAAANNVVQIFVFALLFTGGGVPRQLMGAFIVLGAAVGLVTGLISAQLIKKVALDRSARVE